MYKTVGRYTRIGGYNVGDWSVGDILTFDDYEAGGCPLSTFFLIKIL